MKARIHRFEDLRKAPFVGPRGGLYADPQHKIPWSRKEHGSIPTKKCPRCKGVGHIISRQTDLTGAKDAVASAPCRTCNPRGKVKLDPEKVKALGLPMPKKPERKKKPAPVGATQPTSTPTGPDPRQRGLFDHPPPTAPEKPAAPARPGKVKSPHWHSPNPVRHGQQQLAFSKAYKLEGSMTFQGLDIAVEQKKGSKRRWYDPRTRTEGETVMVHPYGYIRGYKGADGEEVDVFIGPHRDSQRVFVINQRRMKDKRRFDEHKVMLGFRTEDEARRAYLVHYDHHGPQLLGSIRTWTLERFKRWLESGRAKRAEPVAKSGGPYIGPRGGKWADPKHTIPWKDEAPAKPAHRKIKPHPTLGLSAIDVYATAVGDDQVRISQHEDGKHGPTIPRESLKHLVNDLEGRVDVPKHPTNEAINAVRDGKAKMLGKGDDGLAFKAGDRVVKVSTTVPFQPFNPGHRTPAAAAAMLEKQVALGNKLADLGIPTVRSRFEKHGDKGFQIKPFVEIPEKLTREQLDEAQAALHAMHDAGYAMNDAIQVGVLGGKVVFYDTGKAAPAKGTGIYSDKAGDLDHLARLYRDHGEKFVNARTPRGEQLWERAREVAGRIKPGASEKEVGFARHWFDKAKKAREADAKARLDGKDLEAEMTVIEMEHEWAIEDIDKDASVSKSYRIVPMGRLRR